MRAIIVIFLCAAWVFQTGATPRLSVGTVRGLPGNPIEVPLILSFATNDLRDVTALQADVVFEPSLVASGETMTGAALGDSVLASSLPAQGVRRVLIYSLNNALMSNGVLATLPFTAAPGAAGVARLTLENVILARGDATPEPSANADGAVAFTPVFVYPDGHAAGFLSLPTNATSGACWVVQATRDFATWVNLSTNNASGNLLEFTDDAAGTYSYRFYRVVLCDFLTGAPLVTMERQPDGLTHIAFNGRTGRSYVIQGSTDLAQWENLGTNTSGGLVSFEDFSASNHVYRFYRVLQAP